MKVAAVQMNSGVDKDRNVAAAAALVRDAAEAGAELVLLPEKWNLLGPGEALVEGAEPLDGPSIEAARAWAHDLGIHLVAGSFAERTADSELPYNTSVLIGPSGSVLATYRKIHMFDVDVGGVSYRESDSSQAGNRVVVGEGPHNLRIGMSVCYDLRFPEIYRLAADRGAGLFTVPAAFTTTTGRDHWEVLLRARAIENQVFVLAAGQIGPAPPHYESYGRSMVVDPWGTVLATAPDIETFVAADIDPAAVDRVRASLPSLSNRRPQAYR